DNHLDRTGRGDADQRLHREARGPAAPRGRARAGGGDHEDHPRLRLLQPPQEPGRHQGHQLRAVGERGGLRGDARGPRGGPAHAGGRRDRRGVRARPLRGRVRGRGRGGGGPLEL
ncbi:MAG: tetracenomycin polyketide synthesis hydroxylase TcmH(EC:1.-), partial [uncultured Rubrobacteraceae bacterium]